MVLKFPPNFIVTPPFHLSFLCWSVVGLYLADFPSPSLLPRKYFSCLHEWFEVLYVEIRPQELHSDIMKIKIKPGMSVEVVACRNPGYS